jgi:hypothetical protein
MTRLGLKNHTEMDIWSTFLTIGIKHAYLQVEMAVRKIEEFDHIKEWERRAMLCLSSRPWLGCIHQGHFLLTPFRIRPLNMLLHSHLISVQKVWLRSPRMHWVFLQLKDW